MHSSLFSLSVKSSQPILQYNEILEKKQSKPKQLFCSAMHSQILLRSWKDQLIDGYQFIPLFFECICHLQRCFD